MNDEVVWLHLLFRSDQAPRSTIDYGDQDDDYIVEFRKKNLVAISVPVLEYKFVNIDELSRLLKDSILRNNDDQHSTGLIITSPRVVEAIREAVQLIPNEQERDKILKGLRQELILVVGEVTGKKCQSKLGIEYNHDAAKTGNGRALADYIEKNFNKSEGATFRLIYPKSSRSDDTIESTFRNSPIIDIKSVVAYETKPVIDLETILNNELVKLKKKLVEKETNGRMVLNLIFFSPSGLESFLNIDRDKFDRQLKKIFPSHEIEMKYSSIGKTTEAALLRNNLNVHCVPQRPDANSLVESILLNRA